jgi:hypothetical protein
MQVAAVGLAGLLLLVGCTDHSNDDQPGPEVATTSSKATAPPVGVASYTTAVYPAPIRSRNHNLLKACPSMRGLSAATRANAGNQAAAVTRQFESVSLASDLRDSDRALWPNIVRDWNDGDARAGPRDVPILYSARLADHRPRGLGAPNPRTSVTNACGSSLAARSWVVVAGPPNGPALQGAFVFLVRRSHPLLYFVYP